jgi:predicted helicase
MKHMLKQNLSLIVSKQCVSDFRHIIVSKYLADLNLTGNAGRFGSGYTFPLWLYHDDGTRTVNFRPEALKQLTANITHHYEPEQIIDYIYAVLYSPSYRKMYAEYLKTDFPRIPIMKNDAYFHKLAILGKQLRGLHLMDTPDLDSYTTTFPKQGTNKIDKINYEDGKVYINSTQYFGNVPMAAWIFFIGSYQPAQKWLKDRKGRKLSNNDIEHYQKIIKVLEETNRIMHLIDKVEL